MPPKKVGKKPVEITESESVEVTDSGSSEDMSSSEQINVEEILPPGKILGDRYLLIVRIGYGNSASVWLSYNFIDKKYVAIKIQDYQCYDDGKREINIIKAVNKAAKNTQSYCVQMIECFVYEQPDEITLKFVCSVYNLYAGSIYMLIHDGIYKYGLPINTVKSMVKQTLSALAFLKEKVEVIHCDIKPENILFEGIPFSHKRVISTFEKFKFDAKYANICKKYASRPDKLALEIEMLGEAAVVEVNELGEAFEVHKGDDSEIDEEGLIEGDDGFDFSEGDEVHTEESDQNTGDEEDDVEDDVPIDASGAFIYDREEEKLNTRRQSIGDIASIVKCNTTCDFEQFYDFKSVLNNSQNSTDKVDLIDKKYVEKCKIAVTDFGCSYYFKNRSPNEVQDRCYRAPEVIMDFKYGYAIDVWSVACVTFELLTGFALFNPEEDPWTQDIHHLYLMEKIVGTIPPIIKSNSPRKKFLFNCRNKEYNIKGVDMETMVQTSIKERLIKQHLFSEKDAQEAHDFMMAMLVYNPKKRPTASEMLSHKWLSKV